MRAPVTVLNQKQKAAATGSGKIKRESQYGKLYTRKGGNSRRSNPLG